MDSPVTDEDDEGGQVIICQGPPICDLVDEAAEAAMLAGCPWCKRDILLPNGEWSRIEPGSA